MSKKLSDKLLPGIIIIGSILLTTNLFAFGMGANQGRYATEKRMKRATGIERLFFYHHCKLGFELGYYIYERKNK